MGGVKKGAFDLAEADRRFETWSKQKEAAIDGKKQGLSKAEMEAKTARLAEEVKINAERAAAIAKKQAEAAAAAAAAAAPASEEAASEEAATEETSAE